VKFVGEGWKKKGRIRKVEEGVLTFPNSSRRLGELSQHLRRVLVVNN
jgi:hypothetical protein